MSYVGLPFKSTYCVAIWPFVINFSNKESFIINLPSPCEIGTEYISPTCVLESQGDLLEDILVLTILY